MPTTPKRAIIPRLKRYTNLAAAIHLLTTKKITLLDPDKWDDRNDAHFMSAYKDKKDLKSLLAICFAECPETYHHWRVFSPNSDGICIEFKKQPLLETFERHAGVRHKSVDYISLKTAEHMVPSVDELPFMKRAPYEPEKEYRVIWEEPKPKLLKKDDGKSTPSMDFDIELSWVNMITLSPWMHKSLKDSVIEALKRIPNCKSLKYQRSTLIGNTNWQSVADRAGT